MPISVKGLVNLGHTAGWGNFDLKKAIGKSCFYWNYFAKTTEQSNKNRLILKKLFAKQENIYSNDTFMAMATNKNYSTPAENLLRTF